MTTHIIMNATSHESRVVCIRENLFEIIKIAMANKQDHNPHSAPLTDAEGKTSPSFS
jgi:hypothetical protein